MIKIVIVGAGFAGVSAALALEKKYKNKKNVEIVLLDKHNYHIFTPDLFEVACSEEELASASQVKQSISVLIAEIIKGRKIKFLQGEMAKVDAEQKLVTAGRLVIRYDYLVLSVGKQIDSIETPGAETHALAYSSLSDALRIRNQIEFEVQAHKSDVFKKNIRIAIIGGGCRGVALAGELSKVLNIIAWKNLYPREKIEIEIIESSHRLLSELSEPVSEAVLDRLAGLGVKTRFLAQITKIDPGMVELKDGEKIAHDAIIWAAGSRNKIPAFSRGVMVNNKDQIITNEYLQVRGLDSRGARYFDHVFAAGSLAACPQNCQVSPSSLWRQAQDQGEYLAYAISRMMLNRRPAPFQPKNFKATLTVGGKWAIKENSLFEPGLGPYLIRLMSKFLYFSDVLGFWKAMRLILFQGKIFSRND